MKPRHVGFAAVALVGGASWGASALGIAVIGVPQPIVLLEEPTFEERLLAKSEAERQERLASGNNGPLARFYSITSDWIVEPVATLLRFVHLCIIFVPVVLATPLVWLGERRGGRVFYSVLLHQMMMAGPAFIKLGQWAASRTDIFPQAMCETLSRLHSSAAAHSMAQTRRTVEHAFGGRKLEQVFDEFDEVPLGVGAIAQVYKARLREDVLQEAVPRKEEHAYDSSLQPLEALRREEKEPPLRTVAVKVLHPGVDRVVRRDLEIMRIFARMLNVIPSMEWLSLPDETEKFGEMMLQQLDLRIEANNLTRFRENFAQRRTVSFPTPLHRFTTSAVLVEEFANGLSLDVLLARPGGCYDREVADMGLDAFLHMLILDNFTHADLHPGNIMVRFYRPQGLDFVHKMAYIFMRHTKSTLSVNEADTEYCLNRLRGATTMPAWKETLQSLSDEGFRPQLIFIDAGLVTELNATNRKNFLDLFTAVAEFDGLKAGELMVQRCRQPDAAIDPDVFALKMQNLVLDVKRTSFKLGNVKVGDVLHQVLSMVRTHHVRMEGDFINVVLSILLLEGIGRQLNPDMDLFKRWVL